MSGEIEEARSALEAIPAMAAVAATARIERLGGLTNRVFKVATADGVLVLRLPGAGTEAYIDRAVERHNAEVAARAGVSPAVLHFDEAGVMLTEWAASTTMNPERFRDLDAVARAGRAFRRLHDWPEPFRSRFDLFVKMDEYQALLERLGAAIPAGYEAAKTEAAAVRRALEAAGPPLAPCHCDPLAENFLDSGDRMWIVDWEYSGNNDPMWDLGDLVVEAELGPEQEAALLHAYFEGPPPAAARGRVVLHKAMCDLLWTLWGVIQHANNNPVDDFWAYAVNRLERCRRLMASEAFHEALAAVRGAAGGRGR
jgi:thiamine kinase-like enzyme